MFCYLSRHEPSSYTRTQYFQNQFKGLIKPSSGRVSPPTAHHGVFDHSSQEIWRSETFVQVSRPRAKCDCCCLLLFGCASRSINNAQNIKNLATFVLHKTSFTASLESSYSSWLCKRLKNGKKSAFGNKKCGYSGPCCCTFLIVIKYFDSPFRFAKILRNSLKYTALLYGNVVLVNPSIVIIGSLLVVLPAYGISRVFSFKSLQIQNLQLKQVPCNKLGNIGPWSFLYRPQCTQFVLPQPLANINSPVWPLHSVNKKLILHTSV